MLGLENVVATALRAVRRATGAWLHCLLKFWPLGAIHSQQRFRAKNARALRQKECAQLGGEKRGTVRPRIKIEEQTAVVVQEARPNVVDEKFPIGGWPFNTIADPADPVKTNPVRRHEIEFPAEIGQGSLSFDPADDARNIEECSGCAEERLVIGVETEDLVAEKFADVKEVASAAAKIDNAHWQRTVEPKILRALDVDFDPIDDVLETIDPRRARPIRKLVAKFFELCTIERVENATLVDGVRPTTEVFERAGE